MIRKPIIKRKKTRTTPSITLSSPEQHPPDPLVSRFSGKKIIAVPTRIDYKPQAPEVLRQHEPDPPAILMRKESQKGFILGPTKPVRRSKLIYVKQHSPDPLVPRISRKHLAGSMGRNLRIKK